MSEKSLLDIASYRLELCRSQKEGSHAFFQRAVDILKKETTCGRCSIIGFNVESGRYEFIDTFGISGEVTEKSILNISEGILALVEKTGETVFCKNILTDERFGIQKRFRYKGLSFIVSPILLKNEVRGFVCLSDFDRDITMWDKDLIEGISLELAFYLENSSKAFSSLVLENQRERQEKLLKVLQNSRILSGLQLYPYNLKNRYFEDFRYFVKEDEIFVYFMSLKQFDEELLGSTKWFSKFFDLLVHTSGDDLFKFFRMLSSELEDIKKPGTEICFFGIKFNLQTKDFQYINKGYKNLLFYDPTKGQTITFSDNYSNSGEYSSILETFKAEESSIFFAPMYNLSACVEDSGKFFEKLKTTFKFYYTESPEYLLEKINSLFTFEAKKPLFLLKF